MFDGSVTGASESLGSQVLGLTAVPEVHPVVPDQPSTLPPSAVGLSAPDSLEMMYTTADLLRDFPDDDVCLEYIKEQLWPKGLA